MKKKNKCTKCPDQVFAAGLCKKCYRESFNSNMMGLGKRWDLQ